jgi:membrane protease YdiL (CAAX protease family)
MASTPPSHAPPPTQEPIEPTGAPDPATDDPPWSTWTAPAAVLLGLTLGVFGGLVVAILGQTGGSSLNHPTPAVNIIADVVFDLAFVASALYFASMHGRPRPADFGFRPVSLRLGVASVALAGVGYYGVTAIYASLFSLHGKDKLPSELGANKSTVALVAAGIFVCAIAPMAEEFFFRGFLFTVLKRWGGPWVAAVITGILFGLAHTGSASAEYLIPLAFLGFVLCMIRWRTGSLYPCMALHALNNSLALGVNQLHWSILGIIGLMAASLAVIAAVTGPFARASRNALAATAASG